MPEKRKASEGSQTAICNNKRVKQDSGSASCLQGIAGRASHFLQLPPELRNTIYRHVLIAKDPIIDIDPFLKQPPLLQTCRQTRSEALKLWYLSNHFAMGISHCDASLLIEFYWHLSAVNIAGVAITVVAGKKHWTNLMVWCRAIWEGRAHGFEMEEGSMLGEMTDEEAVMRAAHRIVSRKGSWTQCEEELAELRFLVGKIEPGWLQ